MNVGKLELNRNNHPKLGQLIELTMPPNTTNVLDLVEEPITLRLTIATTQDLVTALTTLLAQHEKEIKDSLSYAV